MSKMQKINTFVDISNEEYHSRKEFLSSSTIKTLLKNPYEFINPPPRKESKAFSIGSAIHSKLLEPYKFNEEFAVAPEINKRTKAGKEEFSNFEKENKGKIILSKEDYELVENATKQALKNKELQFYINNGIPESSFFSEIDGVNVKCRPDYYRQDIGVIIDVKSCEDASPDGFSKEVAKWGYYIQAQFYMDTLRSLNLDAHKFMFIAIEKKPPYMVGFYELDPVSLDFGRSEYKRAFEIFKNIDNYKMPVYKDMENGDVVQTITLPNYVYYKKGA